MPLKIKEHLIQDRYVHDYYKTSFENTYFATPYDYDLYGLSGYYTIALPIGEYRGQLSYSSGHNTNHQPPALSDIDALVVEFEVLLESNNPVGIREFLQRDFVIEYLNTRSEEVIHTNIPREVQGHYYTYQTYTARPVIEQLILNHNDVFRRLLIKAQTLDLANQTDLAQGLHHAIVQQLKDLDLQKANLSHLNLEHADLSRSLLGEANLAESNLTDAVCAETDFISSNISKKQLQQSMTYVGAKLSMDFWPYWTEETKNNVLNGLVDLKNYGLKLQVEGIAKGAEVVKLADRLRASINQPSVKHNEAFQRNFLKDLHSQDNLFESHRTAYKNIIANIALCVVSGVIGYLIAGFIHKKLTGNFTFFNKTDSMEKVGEIDRSFTRPKNSTEVLLMGTHQRVGAQSEMNKFFGHTRSNPNDPMGDPKVLTHVAEFLY